MYPMPTIDSILQVLPSKKHVDRHHHTKKDADDVRLDFDDEEIKLGHPTYNQNRESDGLQGQGEEITLTDSELTDLQNLLDHPQPARTIQAREEPLNRERVESPNKIKFTDDLINIAPREDSSNRRQQNRSIPRHMIKAQSGRNIIAQNVQNNQRSFLNQPYPQNPMINAQTPQGFHMGRGGPINLTQQFPNNFGAQFRNAPQMHPHIHAQKAWNSAHRFQQPNMMPMVPPGPINIPQRAMLQQRFPEPGSGLARPQPNLINKNEEAKVYRKQHSDLSSDQKYATEDWFSKVDKQATNKATEGTNDLIKAESNSSVEDMFILELNKNLSKDNKIDPALADLDLEGRSKSPINQIPLVREFSNNSEDNSRMDLVKESEDIKKELHFIEKEKQLTEEMNRIKEFQRKMEEERKRFEDQQKEFQQIRFAEQMRLKEEAKKLQDRQNTLMRMQKLNQERKTMYEKLEKEKKEEEENKQSKKQLEDHYLLNIQDIKVEKQIGSGGSARVYKGTYKEIDVAIKRLNLHSIDIGKAKQEFKREVNTLSKIRHPNLVLFMGVALDNQNLCIVTEFCFGGSLFQLLHQDLHVSLNWKQKLTMALDVSKGMNYLHSAFDTPILHRDLKSLNLLLTQPIKGESDYVCVKITDFGLSRENGLTDEMMTAHTGTYHWMAPEVLNAESYTHKADVYSYAIVLYEIITRTTPYQGLTGAQIAARVVNKQERPDLNNVPEECPAKLKELMIMCWEQDPVNRPSFSDITKELKEITI